MQTPLPSALAFSSIALFLDFDGTLVPIASHPDAVMLPLRQRRLLSVLQTQLEGAVAIISGRSLADLERLTAPLPLTLAGCHGAQRRDSDGTRHAAQIEPEAAADLGTILAEFSQQHPGTVFEDKTYAFALHYRQAPQHERGCRDTMTRLWQAYRDTYQLTEGKCLLELRHHACHKGRAVQQLLDTPPFGQRTPLFIGDDSTDEDAFPVVNAHGGFSVRVGEAAQSHATYRLDSVEEVLSWLERQTRSMSP
ncbi:trehalose 6-phosphatase [Chromohalobacter canadensis]|uniref:Trehalose 6-phosphate phosphatase n=1 Tax=Chromohalobacter canadensis TaxID=141389 RepID=A0A285VFV1_9GAMM|nr:trehalose-phosphatase [Chromohalobacter canadensis]SOC52950.1 trehalose 6-phosphatase [Chromohalobacter canadensis]